MAIKLSTNSWHYKLQTDIFGPRPTFHNFCPYFWLTLFCMGVAPFIYTGVGVKYFFTEYLPPRAEKAWEVAQPWLAKAGAKLFAVAGFLLSIIDRVLCEPLDRFALAHLSDDKLLGLYGNSADYYKKAYECEDREEGLRHLLSRAYDRKERERFLAQDEKFKRWKDMTGDNWEKILADAIARRDEQIKMEKAAEAAAQAALFEREKATKAAEAARRDMLNRIVKYTQYFVKGVGILLAAGILAGIVKGLMAVPWLIVGAALLSIPLTLWGALVVIWTVKWKILGTIAVIAVMLFGSFLLALLIRKCDVEIDLSFLLPGARFIANLVSLIASPFIAFGRFVVDYVKAFKQNNCPQIEWSHE